MRTPSGRSRPTRRTYQSTGAPGGQRPGEHGPAAPVGGESQLLGQRALYGGDLGLAQAGAGLVELRRRPVGLGDGGVDSGRPGHGNGPTGQARQAEGLDRLEKRVARGGGHQGGGLLAGGRQHAGDVDALPAGLHRDGVQTVDGAAQQRTRQRDGAIERRVWGEGDDHIIRTFVQLRRTCVASEAGKL